MTSLPVIIYAGILFVVLSVFLIHCTSGVVGCSITSSSSLLMGCLQSSVSTCGMIGLLSSEDIRSSWCQLGTEYWVFASMAILSFVFCVSGTEAGCIIGAAAGFDYSTIVDASSSN